MPDAVPAEGGVVPGAVKLDPLAPYARPENALESLISRAQEGPDPRFMEASDGEEVPVASPLQPQIQPEPEIKGNPYARIRVLEREKRLQEARERETNEKLSLIVQALEEGAGAREQEDVIEDGDPISMLSRKQDAQAEALKELLKRQEDEKKHQELQQIEMHANTQIQEFAKMADGIEQDLYKKAVAHYVNVMLAEALEDTDKTENEAAKDVGKQIADMKIKFVRAGKNPGEEFFKRAVLHGFQVPQVRAQQSAQQAQGKPSAKEQVAKAKDKKDVLSSISSVQGTVKRDGVVDLGKLDEKDYFRRIVQLAKERGGSVYRTPSLSETLAHKMR